jgi:hypothetical protein
MFLFFWFLGVLAAIVSWFLPVETIGISLSDTG